MLNQIKETLREIRCYHSANELASLVEIAQQKQYSYLEFMQELLKNETSNRYKTRVKRYLKIANLPAIKTFEEFDFNFQTSITKREINEWLTFTWLEQHHNKILMGPPGVGKTHLAIATSFSAIHKGYKVIFYSMKNLIEDMIYAEQNGTFSEYLKKISKYDLIIIDELGYLPLKPACANLLFELINHCYEYRSILITSNKLVNEWGNFFGDHTLVSAILDRLMHHAEAIAINGDSYRMKNYEGEKYV